MSRAVAYGRMRPLKRIILAAGSAGFAAAVLMPAFPELGRPGQNAWGIFILCATLWLTGFIPLSITGLLAIVLLPLLKVMPSREAFALFGNPVVFFIIGVFILAAGLMRSGLSRRMAIFFLRWFDRSPTMLLTGVLLTSGFLSFWMPAHAVAAMMFPLIMEIASSLKLRPGQSEYGKALFMAMAWGAVIGGIATLLGGARNPLAIGMLKENYNLEISFLGWMVAVMPMVIILMGAALLMLLKSFSMDVEDVSLSRKVIEEKIQDIGPITPGEKKMLILMVGTVLTWIFLGPKLDLAVIAILAVVVMFLFRMVTWRDVENYVNWGVILMYGGAIALGSALAQSGAAAWLVNGFGSAFLAQPVLLLIFISGLSIALTEGMSNAATVAVVLPICFGLFDTVNLDPRLAVFAVAVPAGLAFSLPVGTPPNAIAISSGYYRVSDSVKRGVFLSFTAWIVFILTALVYWPLIGLGIP